MNVPPINTLMLDILRSTIQNYRTGKYELQQQSQFHILQQLHHRGAMAATAVTTTTTTTTTASKLETMDVEDSSTVVNEKHDHRDENNSDNKNNSATRTNGVQLNGINHQHQSTTTNETNTAAVTDDSFNLLDYYSYHRKLPLKNYYYQAHFQRNAVGNTAIISSTTNNNATANVNNKNNNNTGINVITATDMEQTLAHTIRFKANYGGRSATSVETIGRALKAHILDN